MEDDPSQECVRIPVAERGEMPSAVGHRCRVGLDLEPEQSATSQFSERRLPLCRAHGYRSAALIDVISCGWIRNAQECPPEWWDLSEVPDLR